MIESKENNFLASPATANFTDAPFRLLQVNNSQFQMNSGSSMHQFRSPMPVRVNKANFENQLPITNSKLGESQCSDFNKSSNFKGDVLRFNTE